MEDQARRLAVLQLAQNQTMVSGVNCLGCLFDIADELEFYIVNGTRSEDVGHVSFEPVKPEAAPEAQDSEPGNIIPLDPKKRH